TWIVTDNSGTNYEYNYNVSNLNYYLTKITDTHNNYVDITYFSSDNVGYINEIVYTKGNGLSKFRTIKFLYEGRADNYPDNSTGKTVKYNNRVNYIDIKVDGYLYKKYDFSYNYAPISGKSLLAQVDEIGKDGVSRLTLAKFDYINNTISFSSQKDIPSPSPWDISDRAIRIGDVNGDGYPDLFLMDSMVIKVALSNNSGWGEIKEYDKNGFRKADNTNDSGIQLGDVNGDGKDDIIRSRGYSVTRVQFYVAYNNGNGWDVPVLIENTRQWSMFYNLGYEYNQLAYVNNDKYLDIVHSELDSLSLKAEYSVCYGNSQGWDDPVEELNDLPFNFRLGSYRIDKGATPYFCGTRLVDINGDGLADMISSYWNTRTDEFHFYYILADGSGWNGVIQELPASLAFNVQWSVTKVFDINRDGFPDIISGREYDMKVEYHCYFGNGKGFGEEQVLESFPPWTSTSRGVLFVDCDKDGIVDCLNVRDNKFVSCNLDSPQDDLLKEVTNRYGGKTTFNYKSPYKIGGTVFPFSLAVLESTTVDAGTSASPAGTTKYYYENGSYDIENRIFRGFGHVKVTDPLNFDNHMYFHQDDSKLGKVKKQENSIQKTVYTYQADSSAPYFTPVIQIEEYIDSKCAKTCYEYDNYGNVTKAIYYGDKDSGGDEKCVLTDYALNPSNWIVSLASQERIFSGTAGSGTPISQALYFYDNNPSHTSLPIKGDLTKVKQYLNTGNSYIQASSVYDSYGNEIKKIDPKGNETVIEYDTAYHTFPSIITNAKGHKERNNYYGPSDTKGLFGQLKEKIGPNNNKTTFEYDTFGRKTKVISPYDTASAYGSQVYEYGIAGPGENYILTRTTEQSGTSNHHIKMDILDGFEKVIQTSQESENEQTYSYTSTIFNKRSEAEKVSLPYFKDGGLRTSYLTPDASIKWTENTYDALGRITKVTKPDNTNISNSYSGWTTTITDEDSHRKIFEKDAYGRPAEVKEENKGQTYVTKYSYDALDNLIKIVDNNSNQTIFTYDSLSRRIAMNDPDLGNWAYLYDDSGNLLKRTDAKGNIMNYTYDTINRLINKNYENSGVNIKYVYDEPASSNPIGRRTSMEDLSGTSRWHYDKKGRITKEEKTIDENNYKLEWAYDAMDRVKSIIYPNLEVVNFSYNNAGYLEGIDDYCLGSNYNPAGQIEQINLKNSLSTGFEYYPLNLRLKAIKTGSLQNLSYEYDNVGNIKKISDSIHSTVKNYVYDDLDRLLSGDGSNYEYNSIGNLIKKNGVAFSYSSTHPHAVINDGQNPYSYDSAGNMISGAGRNITYDPENRPIEISKDSITTNFTYDGDGKRVKKEVKDAAKTTTTIYISNLYEEEFTE
ncbi:MAG: FG-GAP-like repeat-containing protein, partial [Candidatus Omnitrophota bacterium]